jgi:hypothetical protein
MLLNMNNHAWALATVPDDDARDGTLAIEVIREALERKGDRDPGYLDTLAAALAEKGDFAEAVKIEREALASMEAMSAPEEILTQVRDHLSAFEAGQPLRVP